jgi:dTDP-4-dehydrorhamnose reductase
VTVAVIGATGQLGQDLLRVFGDSAIALSHRDLEVTDGAGTVTALQDLRPDWVFNTAAYHHVDDCERNPTTAVAVNALGASNVARAAATIAAGVVFFSTDYVFGGEVRERRRPYSELDNPQPLNVYGVSKVAGEQLVALANPRHLVIRTAGLYGTATSRKGWTFPELMISKARAGDQLRVVDDQTLSPTYTADLAACVKALVERDAVGLFHLTNAGECSWYEFACATLRLAGLDTPVEPVPTIASSRVAQRPRYSALTSRRLEESGLSHLRPWEDALEDYLRAKAVI